MVLTEKSRRRERAKPTGVGVQPGFVKLSKGDSEEAVAEQWRSVQGQFGRPNVVLIYHLTNHYALVYALREWVEPESGEVVRQVLTTRRGQRPTVRPNRPNRLAPAENSRPRTERCWGRRCGSTGARCARRSWAGPATSCSPWRERCEQLSKVQFHFQHMHSCHVSAGVRARAPRATSAGRAPRAAEVRGVESRSGEHSSVLLRA